MAKDEIKTTFTTTHAFLMIFAPACILLIQKLTAMRNRGIKQAPSTISDARSSSENGQSNFHTRRRIQHAVTGLLFYICSFLLPSIVCSSLLTIASISFYLIIQLQSSKSNRYTSLRQWYLTNFGPLLRPHELVEGTFPGAFWFVLGTTILSIAFPLDIARVSLLCLSFGDPLAAWVGIYVSTRYRQASECESSNALDKADRTPSRTRSCNLLFRVIQHKFSLTFQGRVYTKSVAGCLACFIISFVIAIAQWNDITTSLLTGWICMVLESTSCIIGLDDNVVIPVGTGLTLYLYR